MRVFGWGEYNRSVGYLLAERYGQISTYSGGELNIEGEIALMSNTTKTGNRMVPFHGLERDKTSSSNRP